MEPIGVRIRNIRKSKGISLEAIAEKTGLDQGYLSRIETGAIKSPYTATLEKIAGALGVGVDAFVISKTDYLRLLNEQIQGQDFGSGVTVSITGVGESQASYGYTDEEQELIDRVVKLCREGGDAVKSAVDSFLNALELSHRVKVKKAIKAA